MDVSKDWKTYIDKSNGTPIYKTSSLTHAREEWNYPLFDSFILRPNADKLILNDSLAAKKFLFHLCSGDIDFTEQQRVISILYELSQRVNSKENVWVEIKWIFDLAMKEIHSSLLNKTYFSINESIEFDPEDWGGIGGEMSLDFALSRARKISLFGYFRAMIEYYLKVECTRITDLCGDTSLFIENKFPKKIAKSMVGYYGGDIHGELILNNSNQFVLNFKDFPSGMPSCPSFERVGFFEACSVLEYFFGSKPVISTNYWD